MQQRIIWKRYAEEGIIKNKIWECLYSNYANGTESFNLIIHRLQYAGDSPNGFEWSKCVWQLILRENWGVGWIVETGLIWINTLRES